MRRALLYCTGIILSLTAWAILWNAPDLYLFSDSWHSPQFTRMVGAGIIDEGVLAAGGAALCLGRAIIPLRAAPMHGGIPATGTISVPGGGGPVLPICGLLFLLGAIDPLGQAQRDSETFEVMETLPADARYSDEIVDDCRLHERTARTFGILWLVLGGALLGSPLFLRPRVWQLGWPISGVGCGIAAGGFLLSGMGALVRLANGMAMEAASEGASTAGNLGMLAGALVAVVGSIVAILGKGKA